MSTREIIPSGEVIALYFPMTGCKYIALLSEPITQECVGRIDTKVILVESTGKLIFDRRISTALIVQVSAATPEERELLGESLAKISLYIDAEELKPINKN